MQKESNKENQKYIQDKVHPIFEKLLIDLLVSKPENVYDFMRKWIDKNEEKSSVSEKKADEKKEEEQPMTESDEDEEEDEVEVRDLKAIVAAKKQNQRSSVSAEVFGAFN